MAPVHQDAAEGLLAWGPCDTQCMRRALSVLLAMDAATKTASWRPGSAEGLYEFLRGRWQLCKNMDYTPGGGVSGEFIGTATFEPLRCADGGQRLAYLEDGMATLGGGQSVAASKRLLWDMSDAHVRVFFDEARERDPASVLASSRFFHEIELPTTQTMDPPPFVHLCDPDVYRGALSFESDTAFLITWHVEGPKKLGNIVGKYVRATSSP